jgi:hypothetical protein
MDSLSISHFHQQVFRGAKYNSSFFKKLRRVLRVIGRALLTFRPVLIIMRTVLLPLRDEKWAICK